MRQCSRLTADEDCELSGSCISTALIKNPAESVHLFMCKMSLRVFFHRNCKYVCESSMGVGIVGVRWDAIYDDVILYITIRYIWWISGSHIRFLPPPVKHRVCMYLSVLLGVPSGYSGFLLRSKDKRYRQIRISKLSIVCISVWVCSPCDGLTPWVSHLVPWVPWNRLKVSIPIQCQSYSLLSVLYTQWWMKIPSEFRNLNHPNYDGASARTLQTPNSVFSHQLLTDSLHKTFWFWYPEFFIFFT